MSSKHTKAGRRASRQNYCVNLAAAAMRRERVQRRHADLIRELRQRMMRNEVAGGVLSIGASVVAVAFFGLMGVRR